MLKILIALSFLAVSACSPMQEKFIYMVKATEPSIITIGAGYEVDIGEKVKIYGEDQCEMSSGFFSSYIDTSCIKITRDRKEIPVHILSTTGMTFETWYILRKEGPYGTRTSLVRPNGHLVKPVEQS